MFLNDNKIKEIYRSENFIEIYRHGYCFNNKYIKDFEAKGMKFVGKTEDDIVSIAMIENHRFFLGVQFHPELISRPNNVEPNIFVKEVEKDY